MNAVDIERVLVRHSDVGEACVIGVSDRRRVRYPKAYVVLRNGARCDAEELEAYCLQNCPDFGPKGEIVLVSELPRTPSGMVSRRQLAERHLSDELERPARTS